MEPIESSETSAYINTLTPRTYPKEKKLQPKHGESLKSRNPSRKLYNRCVNIYFTYIIWFYLIFLMFYRLKTLHFRHNLSFTQYVYFSLKRLRSQYWNTAVKYTTFWVLVIRPDDGQSLLAKTCSHILLFIYLFYIPWIFCVKPHLDIGMINVTRNTLYNYHYVYAAATVCHSTRIEQFNTRQSVTHK